MAGIEEIKSKELIHKFYRQLPEEYRHYSFDQINKVCQAPWGFLKECISNGFFEPVRFKYFGLFKVRLNLARRRLKDLQSYEGKEEFRELREQRVAELESYIRKNELDTK